MIMMHLTYSKRYSEHRLGLHDQRDCTDKRSECSWKRLVPPIQDDPDLYKVDR